MSSLQRFLDWRRERRIRSLTQRCTDSLDLGDAVLARLWDALRMAEIRRRSPQQVARMERRMGL